MELTARYGLEFNPFLKNSKEILFEGSEYAEAGFRLDYLAKTKGFGLLTGAPGRGKTTLVRSWSSGLNPSLYKVIYSSLSTVTVNDFYRNLAVSLGAQASYRKTENFHIIQDEINRLALDKRKTPVIIIDEANYIKNAVLNDLKILFNFEMDSRDRAVITASQQDGSVLTLSCRQSMTAPWGRRYLFMEFTFLCMDDTGADPDTWNGTICPLLSFDCVEYEVCYRSSCIHLILGEHSQSRYIYIPTLSVAMDISYLNDRFWNREQLSRKYPELSSVDVISIIEALAAIYEHK